DSGDLLVDMRSPLSLGGWGAAQAVATRSAPRSIGNSAGPLTAGREGLSSEARPTMRERREGSVPAPDSPPAGWRTKRGAPAFLWSPLHGRSCPVRPKRARSQPVVRGCATTGAGGVATPTDLAAAAPPPPGAPGVLGVPGAPAALLPQTSPLSFPPAPRPLLTAWQLN